MSSSTSTSLDAPAAPPASKIIVARRWLPVLPVVFAPILLFADVLFSGKTLFWALPVLQFIPWRAYAWESLRQGILPLWNPLSGMGAPLAANYQLALFYPPSWLLYLLAAFGDIPAMAWGHTLLVVLHLIWAGLGMERLLKTLGIGELGQVVGGLAFGLSGYLVARNGVFAMVWTAAWLPWVILGVTQIAVPGHREKISAPFVPLKLVISLTFMLLAGHAQLSWYIILMSGGWVIAGGWCQSRWRGVLTSTSRLAAAGILAGLLASIQLIPTIEYLLQSQRAGSFNFDLAMTYSFWPWRILAFIAPNLFGNPGFGNYWGYAAFWEDAAYIGLLPLVLALSSLGAFKPGARKDPSAFTPGLVRFLWIVIVVVLVLALGKNTPVFPFLYRYIPTFDMFQAPARLLIVVDFSLALLAGIGLESWRKPSGRGLYWLRLGTAGGAAITIGAGAAAILLREVQLTFIPATAFVGVWALGIGALTLLKPDDGATRQHRIWSGAVVVWLTLDLLVAGLGLHPAAERSLYQSGAPEGRAIQEAVGTGRVYLSAEEDYRIKFSRFFRFSDFRPLEDWQQLRTVMLPNINLLDGVASANNFDPLVPGRYDTWMRNLSAVPSGEQEGMLRLMGVNAVEHINIWDPSGIAITPVVGARRWYWTSCGYASDGANASLDQVEERLRLGGSEPVDWVVLEGIPGNKESCLPGATAKIQNLSDRPDKMAFLVESGKPGWLVLSDTWYPGWKVTLDGKPTEIIRANYLFRAVAVPDGKHMVVFSYEPASFIIGFAVTVLGLILLGMLAIRKPSW